MGPTAVKLIMGSVLLLMNTGEGRGTTVGPLFRKGGKVFPAVTFGHIDIPITLQPIIDRLSSLADLQQHLRTLQLPSNHTPIEVARVASFKEWASASIQDVRKKGDLLFSALHVNTKNTTPRPKRQLVIAGIRALVGSAITTLVQGFQDQTLLKVIQQKQEVLATQIQANMIAVHQNQADIQRLQQALQQLRRGIGRVALGLEKLEWESIVTNTQFALLGLNAQVQQLIDGITLAREGRFSVDLIIPGGIQDALQKLQNQGIQDGRKLPIQSALDLNDLPTSCVLQHDELLLHIIVHIPMPKMDTELQLYEYITSPWLLPSPTHNESHPIYVEVQETANYLALTQDQTRYQVFTHEYLYTQCQQLKGNFYCTMISLMKKKQPHCLLQLYEGNLLNLATLCHLIITNHVSRLTPLNETHFLLIETTPNLLEITCKGQLHKRELYQGVQIISFDRGCKLSTEYQTAHRPLFDPTVVVNNDVVTTNTWSTTLPFDNIQNLTSLIEKADKMLNNMGQRVPLQSILHNFQRQIQQAEHTHWDTSNFISWGPHLGTGTAGLSILILLGVTWCLRSRLRQYCCITKPPATAVPSLAMADDHHMDTISNAPTPAPGPQFVLTHC